MKKDSKDKCNPKEDEALYNNTDNKRFLFLVAPSSVTKSYFGLSLSFYVKAIAMIYAFRAFTTVRQFYSTQQNHSTTDLVFNYVCIITAILQYILWCFIGTYIWNVDQSTKHMGSFFFRCILL